MRRLAVFARPRAGPSEVTALARAAARCAAACIRGCWPTRSARRPALGPTSAGPAGRMSPCRRRVASGRARSVAETWADGCATLSRSCSHQGGSRPHRRQRHTAAHERAHERCVLRARDPRRRAGSLRRRRLLVHRARAPGRRAVPRHPWSTRECSRARWCVRRRSRVGTVVTLADLDTPHDLALLAGAIAAGEPACGPNARAALRVMGILPASFD